MFEAKSILNVSIFASETSTLKMQKPTVNIRSNSVIISKFKLIEGFEFLNWNPFTLRRYTFVFIMFEFAVSLMFSRVMKQRFFGSATAPFLQTQLFFIRDMYSEWMFWGMTLLC